MIKHFLIIVCFLFSFAYIFSQNSPDTIIKISEVTIFRKNLYEKENAGMKTTKIDTTILQEKINLSLSEVLSQNSSIFIKNNGRGALATASFRGTAASHTQVSWNGININSPMAGIVDFSLIPVFIIDEINLNHGTSSIAANSGGIGGSVNISNSADWQNRFSMNYSQGIGSYSTFNEYLKLSLGNRKIQSKTRIYHNYSLNNFTFINRGIVSIDSITGEITNPLDTNDNADYRIYGALQELYFRPNSNNIFSVKYWGQKADRTIPRATSYEGPDNSNRNNQSDFDNKLVLDWKNHSAKSKLYFRSGAVHKNILYVLLNSILGYGTVPAIYSESSQTSFSNKAEFTYSFDNSFQIKTSLNADFHFVETNDTVTKTGYKKNRSDFSYFLSINKNFADKLNMNFMVRQDFADNKLTPTIPFFGFDYKLLDYFDLILKGNIARNFHQPTLNDLYWQPGGNPYLEPESGFSYELGSEFQTTFQKNKLVVEITVYRSDIDNWIIWLPTYKGYWQPQNIKRVLSQGIEVNAKLAGKISEFNYLFTGTYAYTSSRNFGDSLIWGDNSYGKQLVYVPLHSGNFMAHFLFKSFHLTYQHNSYSERFTTSSNDITRRDWLYPYFMNDLIIGKEFKLKKIQISTEFKIYNLFNETYHSALYRPMPKRNYLLLVMVKF